MVGEQIPNSYVTNIDKALAMADAGNSERSLAAAGRLVDEILNDPAIVSGEADNLDRDVSIAKRLMGAYSIYPEAFSYLNREERGKQLDNKKMLDALPTIVEHDGLPIVETQNWNTCKLTSEELDHEAETREQIAAVLFDNPPSPDFLRDFDISKWKYNSNPVNVVVNLLKSVDYYKDETDQRKEHCKNTFKYYKECGVSNKATKIQTIIGLLEDAWLEIETDQKNYDFEQEARQALNNKETTLAELEKLWLKGESKIVDGYMRKSETKQHIYDAILSGEASVYKTKQNTV